VLGVSATACSSDEDAPPVQKSLVTASGGTGGSSASGGGSGQPGAGGSSGTSSTTGGGSATGGDGGTGNMTSGGASGRSGRGGRSSGSAGGGSTGGAATGGTGNSGSGGTGSGGTGNGGTGNGGTGGDMSSGGSAGDMGSAGASPSDGCSDGTKPAKGHYTITVGSTERGYALVPSTTDDPVPLVFEFHGAGGDGNGIIASFGLETSLRGKVVLIAPDGTNQGGGTGWASGNNNPDIDLVKALIERAKQDHCIDASRIYAVGFSWGGWMATQTACALGTQIAGFTSVEGGGPMGSSCAGPVAGMVVHGTGDTAEPISSGISTRDKFKTIDGCGDTLGTSTVTGCQQYPGCTKPLLWCQHADGHYIPQFVNDGLPKFFGLSP